MAQELFMKEKLLSLHGVMRINDMEGNEVFEVKGKFFSIHDYMSLYDMEGKELAKIHKKVISLHETHFIEMDGKEVTELRTKLFHPFNQEIDLPEIGWQIRGNFLEHDFSIYDKEDQLRAVVHRKYISLGDGYQIQHFVLLDPVVSIHKLFFHQCNDHIAASEGKSAEIQRGPEELRKQTLFLLHRDSSFSFFVRHR